MTRDKKVVNSFTPTFGFFSGGLKSARLLKDQIPLSLKSEANLDKVSRKREDRTIRVSEKKIHEIDLNSAIFPNYLLTYEIFCEIILGLTEYLDSNKSLAKRISHVVFSIRENRADLLSSLRECFNKFMSDKYLEKIVNIQICYKFIPATNPELVNQKLDRLFGAPIVCEESFDRIVSEFSSL